MKFEEFYNRVMIPIQFERVIITKDGKLLLGITNDEIPMYVNKGIIKLIANGREFSNIEEAIKYYDMLISEGDIRKEWTRKKLTGVPVQYGGNIKAASIKWVDSDGKERDFEVVGSNVKIGADTIVLNMSTAKNCLSAILGLCPITGNCYALKMEELRTSVKQSNIRQEKQWRCLTAEAIATGIREIIKKYPGIKYVRLNEAGEISNLPTDKNLLSKMSDEKKAELAEIDDISKIKKLASLLPELTLYTYTHRSDLKDSLKNLGSNIVINGSGFMIDNAYMPVLWEDYFRVIDEIKSNRIKSYAGEEVNPSNITECVGDCSYCNKCKIARGLVIYVPIHGSTDFKSIYLKKLSKKIINNPEFVKIINSNDSDENKINKIFELLDIKDKEILGKVIPLLIHQKDFIKTLMNDNDAIEDFILAIKAYTGIEYSDDEYNRFITKQLSKDALVSSIESLQGYLKNRLQNVKSESSVENTIKKWEKLNKKIEDIIQKAKDRKKFMVSRDIAYRFRSFLKK